MNIPHHTADLMQQHFHCVPDFTVRAPGRVNLIGEHTDYNGGFVLPCAIDFYTEVSFHRREDKTVRLLAADYEQLIDEFSLEAPLESHPTYHWSNYARGVIDVFQKHHGAFPNGFDLVISGNIPQGAGLSSSASYEVAVGEALNQGFNLGLDKKTIAKYGQQAENEFVGCKCGIMDQLISAAGEKNCALLIDCRSLETQTAAMNPDWEVIIVNSNVRRGLVDSKYNERREQCEIAAKILGVELLRDATLAQLEAAKSQMDDVVYRRAKHVISDSQRAEDMAKALEKADMPQVAKLMRESHRSMKEDFEITHPSVDTLCEIVDEVIGEDGGVRMTGGGFGGCVVALVKKGYAPAVTKAVEQQYPVKTQLTADIYLCTAQDGVHRVSA